jgi:hypothetical protein
VLVAVVTVPQLYDPPAVVEEAVIVTLVTEQVSVAGCTMLTLGTVIFCDTLAEAEAVQLLDGSVTVTE